MMRVTKDMSWYLAPWWGWQRLCIDTYHHDEGDKGYILILTTMMRLCIDTYHHDEGDKGYVLILITMMRVAKDMSWYLAL
jgi:hypothetical protein